MREAKKEKFLNKIKSNILLYDIIKLCFSKRRRDYQQLLRDYIDTPNVIQIKTFGKENQDKIIYRISVGMDYSNTQAEHTGFFAMLRMNAIERLAFSDKCGFIPYIEWGSNCMYSEEEEVNGTKNVFEYYFEQVSDLRIEEVSNSAFVIDSTPKHGRIIYDENKSMYFTSDKELNQMADLYRKYIKLNHQCEGYVMRNINGVLTGKKILAVHIRGTDFKIQLNKHPKVISISDYLQMADRVYRDGNYDQIFLATDDETAVKTFQEHFGSSVVYYADVMRSDGDKSLALIKNNRKNHHYMLGLEVIRDMYTLANCSGFIGNLSQVSTMVRVYKRSKQENFESEIIMDNGVNTEGADWETVFKQQKSEYKGTLQ